ncbi:MAG: FprA family A-type flavoprotein [Bacillota bacterium]
MSATKLMEGIYWVGAVDWNLRYFHGPAYSTHRGTTYNAYLIIDDQVTLVDTVYRPFAEELIKHISEIIDPAKIDNVVVNHVETDHSGAFPEIMKIVPNARVFCSQRGMEGLKKHFYLDCNYQVVKTGDVISTGKKSLTFVEAPMLHWPDSMFTYIKEDALLMPNDAFGQHIATSHRFDDEVDMNEVMEEAAKYYANILLPLSTMVLKKIEDVTKMGIDIKMIAPSHGIIWRKDPGRIIDAYLKWASGEAERKVLVVYDTMWGSTEKMAKAILEGVASTGVPVKLFKLSASDHNDIMKELMNARAIILGSPTMNNGILPTMATMIEEMKVLKPRNRVGVVFGSYGWGGGAIKYIEDKFREAGVELIEDGLGFKWVPSEEELSQCVELGKRIAARV